MFLFYTNHLLDIDVPLKHTSCVAPKFPRQALDLLTTKWGHVMDFLPVDFTFLCSSVLDLGSGTGQTDRQTAINA